jgi:hypothetical protein
MVFCSFFAVATLAVTSLPPVDRYANIFHNCILVWYPKRGSACFIVDKHNDIRYWLVCFRNGRVLFRLSYRLTTSIFWRAFCNKEPDG